MNIDKMVKKIESSINKTLTEEEIHKARELIQDVIDGFDEHVNEIIEKLGEDDFDKDFIQIKILRLIHLLMRTSNLIAKLYMRQDTYINFKKSLSKIAEKRGESLTAEDAKGTVEQVMPLLQNNLKRTYKKMKKSTLTLFNLLDLSEALT